MPDRYSLEHACLYGRSTAGPVQAPNSLQLKATRLRTCSYCGTVAAVRLRGEGLHPICAVCSDRLAVDRQVEMQRIERQRRG
jgi:hypothetical protein